LIERFCNFVFCELRPEYLYSYIGWIHFSFQRINYSY